MSTKQIIPCAICFNPQSVDKENLYSVIAKATGTPIEELRSTNYEFICSDCTKTATYRDNYFSSKGKPHVALTKEATVVNN